MSATPAYRPRRPARERFIDIRAPHGPRVHLHEWGDAALARAGRPTLLLLHGWMDVAASFQLLVDALGDDRHIVAADWRGFGRSSTPPVDSYWFPDYLGDLDALVDALSPDAPLDLLGHSMGGNAVMIYAGVRPSRVRRLVNLEGFGMPATRHEDAPRRYAKWLDELKEVQSLRSYASLDAVAARLCQNNPRLDPAAAAWLAAHWSERRADGQWHVLGDPAHKRVNPVQYQVEEVLACWRRIEAPTLWVEGDETDVAKWWGTRYPRSEFDARIAVVPRLERVCLAQAGHMLHLDQPQALAQAVDRFLDATAPA